MKNERLVFISDIWGIQNNNTHWLNAYVQNFQSYNEITVYDSQKLARIDTNINDREILHDRFVTGGIEQAVHNLLQIQVNKVDVIAFSIGGYIAWKALANGMKIQNFCAVSSTRLRLINRTLEKQVLLIYGEKDLNKPDAVWFDKMNIKPIIIENGSHQVYSDEKFIDKICGEIKKSFFN